MICQIINTAKNNVLFTKQKADFRSQPLQNAPL